MQASTLSSALPCHLQRLDTHSVAPENTEMRLFAVARNEGLRLPAFLDHYRALGVQRFFLISNDSTDDTVPFLLAQPDVCVFHTAESYAQARAGLAWLNPLITTFGGTGWIFCTDVDELFVYPHMETRSLAQLTHWLDREGYEGVFALMLDVYSDKPLNCIDYTRGQPFLEACPFFDSEYAFVKRLGLPWKPAFPDYEPIGGPRLRLCFPDQNTPNLFPRLKVKILSRLGKLAKRLGLSLPSLAVHPAPQAFKMPFVRWNPERRYITSHRTTPLRLSPLRTAVMHVKYLQDFSERIDDALKRKSHYAGSAEYKRYGELLAHDPELSFVYAGSRRWKDSGELVKLGLMKSAPTWEGESVVG